MCKLNNFRGAPLPKPNFPQNVTMDRGGPIVHIYVYIYVFLAEIILIV